MTPQQTTPIRALAFLMVAAAAAPLALPAPAHAAPAAVALPPSATKTGDATVPLPYALGVRGSFGRSEVLVQVPQGATPTRVTGIVDSTYTIAGTLQFTVNDRAAATVPMTGGRVTIPLTARDIQHGSFRLGLVVRAEPDRDCWRDESAGATLNQGRLQYTMPVAPPDTLATFLSPGVSSFTVAVPRNPTPAESTAGLNAVLALRHRFSAPTTVDLVTTNDVQGPPSTFAKRVVNVREVSGATNAIAVDGGTLQVTGDAESLAAAASSLGDPNLALLRNSHVSNLDGAPDYHPAAGRTTLDKLGLGLVSVQGIGRNSASFTVPQAAFGAPLEQLDLRLRGTVTPLSTGQQGRLDILVDGVLRQSVPLSADRRTFDLPLTLRADALTSAPTITAQLTFLPADGHCSNPGVPARVDIDPRSSTAEPTFGDSLLPGFGRFPQAFGAEIPVALTGRAATQLPLAAAVLGAATDASPWQYTTEVTDVENLPAHGARLVVVDDAAAAKAAGAPLAANGAIDPLTFPAGVDTPYAALQAFAQDGNDVIVAGGSNSDAARGTTSLTKWMSTVPWGALQGQVYVIGDKQVAPEAYTVPETPEQSHKRAVRAQVIAGAVVTTLLVTALGAWLVWRPRKRRA